MNFLDIISAQISNPGTSGVVSGHIGWRENIQIKVGKGGTGLVKT